MKQMGGCVGGRRKTSQESRDAAFTKLKGGHAEEGLSQFCGSQQAEVLSEAHQLCEAGLYKQNSWK